MVGKDNQSCVNLWRSFEKRQPIDPFPEPRLDCVETASNVSFWAHGGSPYVSNSEVMFTRESAPPKSARVGLIDSVGKGRQTTATEWDCDEMNCRFVQDDGNFLRAPGDLPKPHSSFCLALELSSKPPKIDHTRHHEGNFWMLFSVVLRCFCLKVPIIKSRKDTWYRIHFI